MDIYRDENYISNVGMLASCISRSVPDLGGWGNLGLSCFSGPPVLLK